MTEATLIKMFAGKDILFLENDFDLYHSVGEFRLWLVKHGIKHNTLLNLEKTSMEYIMEVIEYHKIIVFQSTFTTEFSRNLTETIISMKDAARNKKTIIECCERDGTWQRKPKCIHDFYSFGIESRMDYAYLTEKWRIRKITNMGAREI